jgi:CheY-like chemotaxis protein
MADQTILYISEPTANSNSVSAALKATGYEVVNTSSANQGIALLYLLHSVAGVVLNRLARDQKTDDVARSLRAIRPDVPIVLVCSDQIKRLPSFVDGCVDTKQPLEKFIAAVRCLFLTKRFQWVAAQL